MSISINKELNKPNKQGLGVIIFRVRADGTRLAISSGIRIKETDWNINKKNVRQSDENASKTNALLSKYEKEIEGAIIEAQLLDKKPTKEFISPKLSFITTSEKVSDLNGAFELFLEVHKESKSKGTIEKYNYTLTRCAFKFEPLSY